LAEYLCRSGCVVSSAAGSVRIAGAQPIDFSEFEQSSITGQCVAAEVSTLGPLAMLALAALLGITGVLLVMRR
jgi:hypothetical protein